MSPLRSAQAACANLLSQMNKIVFRSLIHERSYRKRLICGPNKEDYVSALHISSPLSP